MFEASVPNLNHRYAVDVLPVWRLLSASTVTSLSAAADPVARGDSRLDSGDIKDVSGGGSLTSPARPNAAVAPLRSVL